MLDKLFTPIPMWLFFVLAILTMWELRKYRKKPGVGTVTKNNINDKLNEDVYIFPKQEVFILSKYGDNLEDDLASYNKNAKKSKKGRTSFGERRAKIINDFGLYQQFLNQYLSDGFIAERTDSPFAEIDTYDAPSSGVCFDVYKGRTKVGIIEVTDDSLLSEKNYGSRFDAKVSVRLDWPGLFDYQTIYSFFLAVARTHFKEEPNEANTSLKLKIQEALTEYLWNVEHREEANSFSSENKQFEHDKRIEIHFSGTYDSYQIYLDECSQEQMFSREKSAIDGLEEHFGYKRVEKD
jgi:hypothetical protein